MAKHDDGGGLGKLDMFGFDEFGQPGGPPAGAMYGALAGAVFQTGTAIGVRKFTDHDKFSEAIGGAVGMLAGGLMIAMGRQYATMGWTCLAVSGVTGLLRQLEVSLGGGLSGVQIQQLKGVQVQ